MCFYAAAALQKWYNTHRKYCSDPDTLLEVAVLLRVHREQKKQTNFYVATLTTLQIMVYKYRDNGKSTFNCQRQSIVYFWWLSNAFSAMLLMHSK